MPLADEIFFLLLLLHQVLHIVVIVPQEQLFYQLLLLLDKVSLFLFLDRCRIKNLRLYLVRLRQADFAGLRPLPLGTTPL